MIGDEVSNDNVSKQIKPAWKERENHCAGRWRASLLMMSRGLTNDKEMGR